MTPPLTAERWAELEPLLDAAMDCPPEQREAFVRRAASGDAELEAALLSLAHDVDRATALPLLERTASGVFASLLRDEEELAAGALETALAGRYRIARKLGAGGMATVYLATEGQTERQVALKVLHPDLSHTLGAERFAREVRLMATLEHPNIVGALDSGEADGHLWFTMPFVDGESLRQRIARVGQLPLDEALSIFRQSAAALSFAHARGIIHRDIKPDNILLSGDQAWVADFGIARALESTGETLTMTGTSIGTPAYMPPEQAAGEKALTERVDVYAMGAVLYEMLAGVTAFTGPSVQAIIVRAMTSDPQPIHPIRTAVTPALDAVILKAMSRTPADRFATMIAFAEAVEVAAVSKERPSAVTGAAGSSPRPGMRPRTKAIIGIAALAVLAAAALLTVQTVAARPPRLAVLTFENRSSDTTDAYLGDAFTEELGNRVSQVQRLSVVSTTASRRARVDDSVDTRAVGQQLGANFLMSGSVQRIAGRLRVTVELVRAASGDRVWGESYNRAESELPLLLHDIAVAAAGGMLGDLDAIERERLAAPTENSAAYDHYLRGSRTRLDEGAAGLQQSITEFETALILDPRFAAAQARLAAVYARSLFWSVELPGVPTDSVVARAAVASARALALDSASADAWAGRGTVLFFGPARDYEAAAAALRRAAAIDSTNAHVHWMQGQILRRLGDFAGAEAASRAALVADPFFAQAYNQLANLSYTGRRFEQALAFNDSATALLPTQWQYWELRARIAIALGDSAGSRQHAEHAVNLSPPEQREYAEIVLAQAEAFSGDTVRARARLEPVLAGLRASGPLSPRDYQLAIGLIATGRPDQALAILERIAPRGPWLWSYLVMPGFDPVRDDPRFVSLEREARPANRP